MVKPKDESRIKAAQTRANAQWEMEVKFYQDKWEQIGKGLERKLSPTEQAKLEKERQYVFDCLQYCQAKLT